MRRFFTQITKHLSASRVIADLIIAGICSGVFRLIAWLTQVQLVSELAFWLIVPAAILTVLLILTVILGPYLGPRFRISIDLMSFAVNEDRVTLGYFMVKVRNTGTASTIDSWEVSACPATGSKIIGKGVSITEPAKLTVGKEEMTFEPKTWLLKKGVDNPIPRGGRIVGMYIAQFDGIGKDDLARLGTQVTISGVDCYGTKHFGKRDWGPHHVGPVGHIIDLDVTSTTSQSSK